MQIKQKLQSAIHHPAAGLVTVVAVNTAIVVASYVVTKKMEAKLPPVSE